MRTHVTAASFALALALTACSAASGNTGSTAGSGGLGGSGGDPSGGSGGSAAAGGSGGEGGSLPPLPCIPADGDTAGSGSWTDAPHEATVAVGDKESCARTYTLSTTAPLRDDNPANPRVIAELPGQPVLRTGNDLVDAFYALAHAEVREASVDAIRDGSFHDGAPIPCAPGGCFETGRLWTYVWTRDTAYAAALGLASVDPRRTQNSLLFKLSEPREGGGLQIVQDTGTGGSYPVSSDRAVWALGAVSVLRQLEGDAKLAFAATMLEALTNTALHDREVVFDPSDGLYRGEQSFLDWREQTYPGWTATDPAHIAMSKALGTNVTHLALLDAAVEAAEALGDGASASTFAGWAADLRVAIEARFWLEGESQLSTFVTTTLDPSPTRRFDLLGTSLAVLHDVLSPEQAALAVASYPHLPKGPPVSWPQQQDTPIYHNRAIWPFVTAFGAKAAAKVGNDAVVSLAARSLLRGAALNLSNMENFEVVTGAAWLDEGPTSGPVVNSQRQLWSVAGALSLVHDVLFGLTPTRDGLVVKPFVPRDLRASLFGGTNTLSLTGVRYQGKRLVVVLHLPPVTTSEGAYDVGSITLDGAPAPNVLTNLQDGARIDVTLVEGPAASAAMRLVSQGDAADYRNLFGPKTPAISGLGVQGGLTSLALSTGGEAASDVTFAIYRDGALAASDLAGSTTSWVDPQSADRASVTHCYSVETTFTSSGTHSQHSAPVCDWGDASERVQSYDAFSFVAEGGTLVNNHGRWHYEGWGYPDDSLAVVVTPEASGLHLVQLEAGNGMGPVNTGVTCAVKTVEVWDGATLVASAELVAPHLGTWDAWRGSTLLPVTLEAQVPYVVRISEGAGAMNMSDFSHFALYGGAGGKGGRSNFVNIAEVKLLRLGP